MERVSWTYELPPAAAPDTGLEHYQVASPEGHVGIAAAVLGHDGDVYLAVSPSGFPVTHRLVAVPWEAVERVDHEALTVLVRSLDEAVELDPDSAVEGGPADARRLTELPPELRRWQPTGDVAGPADRPPLFGALGVAALGFVALLGALAVVGLTDSAWRFALLAVPAVLLVVAGALAVAAWKRPYAAATRSDRR